jgi:hypothetical protein
MVISLALTVAAANNTPTAKLMTLFVLILILSG